MKCCEYGPCLLRKLANYGCKILYDIRSRIGPTFRVAVDDAVAGPVAEVVLGVAGRVVERDQIKKRKFWKKFLRLSYDELTIILWSYNDNLMMYLGSSNL
jgi:hypothetical protein